MAPFLLFVFVFASQVIGGLNTKLLPPSYGNTISILSIDGGGIKGILPTVILEHLEKALQAKDEKAVLADYFDVIAGTSTGGLIATMLASPDLNDHSRPAFNASEIKKFYLDFDTPGPKYDGRFLHDKVHEILQETRLHDTLTNLVVPSFDTLYFHPVIFSSFKINETHNRDAKLADICLGTSAAPTQLPPYAFFNDWHYFNLVDGFFTANSPALLAVTEVVQQLNEKNPSFIHVNENEPTKFVLLSLGNGGPAATLKFGALYGGTLSANQWIQIIAGGLAVSAGDINEYHLKTVFPGPPFSDNYYLRIDEYNLDESITADNVTKESLDKIVKAIEDLLKQTVKAKDITSFDPHEKPIEGTNAEALESFADILYKEKQLRLKMKSMEKREQPFIE
ncbi:hypothetical protein P8452_73364 [Trifolium repens]|nr:hypothetical protein P8452_73364 [Trifolium repens]